MPKNNTNSEMEVKIGFHAIRKSTNSLIEDLYYFQEIPHYFSTAQIINILGQIEEVENRFKQIRQIFSRKIE